MFVDYFMNEKIWYVRIKATYVVGLYDINMGCLYFDVDFGVRHNIYFMLIIISKNKYDHP